MPAMRATPTQSAAPFFSSLFGGGRGTSSNTNTNTGTAYNDTDLSSPPNGSGTSPAKSRPATGAGDAIAAGGSPRQPNVLHKDRRPSFGRKPSFSWTSPGRGTKSRRDSSPSANGGGGGDRTPGHRPPAIQLFSDSPVPPLPDIALSAAAKLSRDTEAVIQSPASAESFSFRMLSRGAPTPISAYPVQLPSAGMAGVGPASELSAVHQHIQETANKRISTLDYLRRAHEGRIYWFNTLLFDKPDVQRLPHYTDARKLARRATNYFTLGISLPAALDLNAHHPVDFLRSLNTVLAEFDSFQQLHSESGAGPSSLTRAARLPHLFRRAAGGGGMSMGMGMGPGMMSKGRRSSSAAGTGGDVGYALEQVESNTGVGGGGAVVTPLPTDPLLSTSSSSAVGDGVGVPPTPSTASPAGLINFAASEVDLLPGEEYTHLLTPSLPFDPDFFETFATLCDVLIDTYARLLALLPTPRECGGPVGELFAKADGKVRKLLLQGVVKEFEEAGRAGVKSEVANVGKVVLSGLM